MASLLASLRLRAYEPMSLPWPHPGRTLALFRDTCRNTSKRQTLHTDLLFYLQLSTLILPLRVPLLLACYLLLILFPSNYPVLKIIIPETGVLIRILPPVSHTTNIFSRPNWWIDPWE